MDALWLKRAGGSKYAGHIALPLVRDFRPGAPDRWAEMAEQWGIEMKVIKTEPVKGEYVQFDGDGPQYLRLASDNWFYLAGECWEPRFQCEDLETAYQLYELDRHKISTELPAEIIALIKDPGGDGWEEENPVDLADPGVFIRPPALLRSSKKVTVGGIDYFVSKYGGRVSTVSIIHNGRMVGVVVE